MFFSRILTVLFVGITLISSCTQRVEREAVDYQNDKNIKLPDWECHQVYSIKRDLVDGASYLETVAFPEKKYPGLSLRWLNGDWSAFTSLRIIARTRGSGPAKFYLTVWDGKGSYDYHNRFQKEYILDTGWTVCELPIYAGMAKPNGTGTDIRSIANVVFFTVGKDSPTVFDVKAIRIE